jgi:hypothetical protein
LEHGFTTGIGLPFSRPSTSTIGINNDAFCVLVDDPNVVSDFACGHSVVIRYE